MKPDTAPKRGRPLNAAHQEALNKFLAMKPGQSFFVEGANSRDLEFLRRMANAKGAGMKRIEVQQDEIYGIAGVRCWRLSGPYDNEL